MCATSVNRAPKDALLGWIFEYGFNKAEFEVADQNARSRAAVESSVRYSISAAEWRGTTA